MSLKERHRPLGLGAPWLSVGFASSKWDGIVDSLEGMNYGAGDNVSVPQASGIKEPSLGSLVFRKDFKFCEAMQESESDH